MEDYRCQLGDFVNILLQTDKYMSANGNEKHIFSILMKIHLNKLLWKLFNFCLIERCSHIKYLNVANSVSYINFISDIMNALWYYNSNLIKYEWLDDRYFLIRSEFITISSERILHFCTRVSCLFTKNCLYI